MMINRSKISIIVAAATIVSTASIASASEPMPITAKVRYGDLNLTQVADQKRLQSRVERAATRVCTDPGNSRINQNCRQMALSNAATPVATAIARAESGERFADAGDMSIGISQ